MDRFPRSFGSVRLRGTENQLSRALTELDAHWVRDSQYECSLFDSDALPRNRSVLSVRFTVQPSADGFLIAYRVKNSVSVYLFSGLLLLMAIIFAANAEIVPTLFLLCCVLFFMASTIWQRRKCILRFRAAFEAS